MVHQQQQRRTLAGAAERIETQQICADTASSRSRVGRTRRRTARALPRRLRSSPSPPSYRSITERAKAELRLSARTHERLWMSSGLVGLQDGLTGGLSTQVNRRGGPCKTVGASLQQIVSASRAQFIKSHDNLHHSLGVLKQVVRATKRWQHTLPHTPAFPVLLHHGACFYRFDTVLIGTTTASAQTWCRHDYL